jgi:undecaprenyl diphosphate synthase
MEIPKHIAIIMDGNRRWAQKKKLPGMMGHRAGSETVDVITEACSKFGIEALTLYAFSTENWKRSKKEVEFLLSLLRHNLKNKAEKFKKNNIRFNVIGRTEDFPKELRDEIAKLIDMTSGNTGLTLTLALNYGGRQEIVDAVKRILAEDKDTRSSFSALNEETFGKYIYTEGLPDPDLIIRTSGEMRLSNFLLWQSAYSELYVTETLWPDFDEKELKKALDEYGKRSRRYGK